MRAMVIEVVAPYCNQMAGMAQAVEQVFIQALISHPTIEAFDKAVLHRLARGYVVPLDLAIFLPFQDSVRGQLGAIVRDHHAGIAAYLGDTIQLPGNTKT